MRWCFLLIPLYLAGCASGKVLGDRVEPFTGATHLRSATSQSFYIRPLFSKDSDFTTVDMKGIWVSKGWFQLEYACFAPKNNPKLVVISESNDYKNVFIEDSQQLVLQCDPDELGQVDFRPAVTQLTSSDDGCTAVPIEGKEIGYGYNVSCSFPYSMDPAQARSGAEHDAALACKTGPGSTIVAYTENRVSSPSFSTEWRLTEVTVECH